MLPLTRAIPKEMLPVVDRPVIQHVVDEALAAGVARCCIVVSKDKPEIARHFQHHESVSTVDQPKPLGLGDAVLRARPLVDGAPFMCLLGDTIFDGRTLPATQLTAAFDELGACVVGLEVVPDDRVNRYGIVEGTRVRDGVIRIERLLEKPSPQATTSRHAIAARYVLTPGIFASLEQLTPEAGGEIQLTDALGALAAREPVYGVVLGAHRLDIGNPRDWLRANVRLAMRDPQIADEVREQLDRTS